LRVYVKGALALCQAILPAVRNARWGRFIFLGSAGLIGAPPARMAAYLTAKSAALGLMKSLAVELGPLGMTVNTVSPGLTLDDPTGDYSPRVQKTEAQRNPVRRLARATDSAHMVRFLMSDEASFINGNHLPITGGSPMI
jgi:3-oxoacyl-[acyl-carrier protein] reductase